jgi:hypothetical protein
MQQHDRLLSLAWTILLTSVLGCGTSAPEPEVEWIDPNEIQSGPIRHDTLPDELLARIKRVHATFADVDGMPLDKWIDDFKRDGDPESNVRIWEDMEVAYNSFCKDRNLPLDTRKEVFKVVLFRSMAPDDEVLARVELKRLTRNEAKEILAAYPGEATPITVIRSDE